MPPLLQAMELGIMFHLLMILHVLHGSFHLNTSLKFLNLSNILNPPWKTFLTVILKFYAVTVVVNIPNTSFSLFVFLLEYYINSFVLTPLSRMVLLRGNIAT